MTKKLTDALQKQKKATTPYRKEIYGTLGIPLGGSSVVKVPNRPPFVYVKLRDNQNEIIEAFNNSVATSYGLPVIVVWQDNRYVVKGVDTARYQNNWSSLAPFLPQHGSTHSFNNMGGGQDVVWVYSRQFMPLLGYPANSGTVTSLQISPYIFENTSGTWSYLGNTGTIDLTQYAPTGGLAAMITVFLDRNTGNPGYAVNSGSYFSSSISSIPEILPYIPTVPSPTTQLPITAVRILGNSPTINWSQLYDLRQFIQPISTGSFSGGGSSVDTIGFAGLYNGVPLGTGTFLNVRGNASFTKSGSMFDLFVSGSTQGNSFNGIPVYNNNTFIATGTIFQFDQNLYVTATGSSIFVRAPVTTYFRVGQPTPLSSPSGLFYQVPDQVYASGSLGVFVNGHALIPGVDYNEQLWISGTYQYAVSQGTGMYHLVHYGVPCYPQTQPSTGTTDSTLWLTDSDVIFITDSDGIQLTDSDG